MSERVVLVDTNLLVLLSVGMCDRGYIAKHRRTSQFVAEDYDLLLRVLSSFNTIRVTPNILAECSNLCGYIAEPARRQILFVLKRLIEDGDELYVESKEATTHGSYLRLGLTDAAIHIAANQATVLTTDLDLYLSLLHSGIQAVNFNHVREFGWRGGV